MAGDQARPARYLCGNHASYRTWRKLCSVIEPHYLQADNGRRPLGLERMLCMCFVQDWFHLADQVFGDALLDSTALRRLHELVWAVSV